MNAINANVLDVLKFLLPGFLAASVLYSLTPFPKREPFERTVQALIFTILIQAGLVAVNWFLVFVGRTGVVLGAWDKDVELVWSVLLSLILGLALAKASNGDVIHRHLRGLGVTHQTSFSSEWYGALARGDSYAVLHLTGERRLYGWPEEWPSTPGSGHFVMIQAEWLEESERKALPSENRVIVSASDVEFVELIPIEMDNKEN